MPNHFRHGLVKLEIRFGEEHPPKLLPWHSQWGGVSSPAPPHYGEEHSENSRTNIHMAYISKYNTSAFQKKSPAALKRSIISVKMFRLRRLNFTLEYFFLPALLSYPI